MAEIVGAFLRTEPWDERANSSSEARNSSRSGLAQELFKFAVGHLNRVQVRRVLWKVANCRPHFLNRLANAGSQVDSAVIHHDDVTAPERGYQALLDICEEHPRARRSGWSDVLWCKLPGPVPARRRLHRQDFARYEAGRYPGGAAHQVRSRQILRPPRHWVSRFPRRCLPAPTRCWNRSLSPRRMGAQAAIRRKQSSETGPSSETKQTAVFPLSIGST
jgi:hypothetical protein